MYLFYTKISRLSLALLHFAAKQNLVQSSFTLEIRQRFTWWKGEHFAFCHKITNIEVFYNVLYEAQDRYMFKLLFEQIYLNYQSLLLHARAWTRKWVDALPTRLPRPFCFIHWRKFCINLWIILKNKLLQWFYIQDRILTNSSHKILINFSPRIENLLIIMLGKELFMYIKSIQI